jgi:hypothetical protein
MEQSMFENEAAALGHSEPTDVESGVVNFYSGDGTYLEPCFTKPSRRLFGFVLSQGQFKLIPKPEGEPTVDSLEVALDESSVLNPNAHFSSIKEIRKYVLARRGEGAS